MRDTNLPPFSSASSYIGLSMSEPCHQLRYSLFRSEFLWNSCGVPTKIPVPDTSVCRAWCLSQTFLSSHATSAWKHLLMAQGNHQHLFFIGKCVRWTALFCCIGLFIRLILQGTCPAEFLPHAGCCVELWLAQTTDVWQGVRLKNCLWLRLCNGLFVGNYGQGFHSWGWKPSFRLLFQ